MAATLLASGLVPCREYGHLGQPTCLDRERAREPSAIEKRFGWSVRPFHGYDPANLCLGCQAAFFAQQAANAMVALTGAMLVGTETAASKAAPVHRLRVRPTGDRPRWHEPSYLHRPDHRVERYTGQYPVADEAEWWEVWEVRHVATLEAARAALLRVIEESGLVRFVRWEPRPGFIYCGVCENERPRAGAEARAADAAREAYFVCASCLLGEPCERCHGYHRRGLPCSTVGLDPR